MFLLGKMLTIVKIEFDLIFIHKFRGEEAWQSIRGTLDEASKIVPHFENGEILYYPFRHLFCFYQHFLLFYFAVRVGADLHQEIENLKKENVRTILCLWSYFYFTLGIFSKFLTLFFI